MGRKACTMQGSPQTSTAPPPKKLQFQRRLWTQTFHGFSIWSEGCTVGYQEEDLQFSEAPPSGDSAQPGNTQLLAWEGPGLWLRVRVVWWGPGTGFLRAAFTTSRTGKSSLKSQSWPGKWRGLSDSDLGSQKGLCTGSTCARVTTAK